MQLTLQNCCIASPSCICLVGHFIIMSFIIVCSRSYLGGCRLSGDLNYFCQRIGVTDHFSSEKSGLIFVCGAGCVCVLVWLCVRVDEQECNCACEMIVRPDTTVTQQLTSAQYFPFASSSVSIPRNTKNKTGVLEAEVLSWPINLRSKGVRMAPPPPPLQARQACSGRHCMLCSRWYSSISSTPLSFCSKSDMQLDKTLCWRRPAPVAAVAGGKRRCNNI